MDNKKSFSWKLHFTPVSRLIIQGGQLRPRRYRYESRPTPLSVESDKSLLCGDVLRHKPSCISRLQQLQESSAIAEAKVATNEADDVKTDIARALDESRSSDAVVNQYRAC